MVLCTRGLSAVLYQKPFIVGSDFSDQQFFAARPPQCFVSEPFLVVPVLLFQFFTARPPQCFESEFRSLSGSLLILLFQFFTARRAPQCFVSEPFCCSAVSVLYIEKGLPSVLYLTEATSWFWRLLLRWLRFLVPCWFSCFTPTAGLALSEAAPLAPTAALRKV